MVIEGSPLLPFLVDAADRKIVLEWLLDLLLYLPPLASAPHEPPAGLSRAAAKRVCGKLADHEVRGELLAAKKRAALRLLDASTDDGAILFGPAESMAHWVVAACDGDSGVERIADGALRKRQEANLDEPSLIDSLLSLVLGAQPTRSTASESDPVHGRTAASTAVRLRAIGLLCRSVGAANRFPGTIQAIFHSVFGSETTPKLQLAGLQLGYWTVQHCSTPLLVAAGAHLLAGMLKACASITT